MILESKMSLVLLIFLLFDKETQSLQRIRLILLPLVQEKSGKIPGRAFSKFNFTKSQFFSTGKTEKQNGSFLVKYYIPLLKSHGVLQHERSLRSPRVKTLCVAIVQFFTKYILTSERTPDFQITKCIRIIQEEL